MKLPEDLPEVFDAIMKGKLEEFLSEKEKSGENIPNIINQNYEGKNVNDLRGWVTIIKAALFLPLLWLIIRGRSKSSLKPIYEHWWGGCEKCIGCGESRSIFKDEWFWMTIYLLLLMFVLSRNTIDIILRRLLPDQKEIELRDGWTPLHFAIANDKGDSVRLLLNHGANVNLKYNDEGVTAVKLAENRGKEHILKMIKEYSARKEADKLKLDLERSKATSQQQNQQLEEVNRILDETRDALRRTENDLGETMNTLKETEKFLDEEKLGRKEDQEEHEKQILELEDKLGKVEVNHKIQCLLIQRDLERERLNAECKYDLVLRNGVENYIGQIDNSPEGRRYAGNRNLMFNSDRGGQVDGSDPEYTDGWVRCSR